MENYSVIVNFTDGEVCIYNFAKRENALDFAREECKWELTDFVIVTDSAEKEIFSQHGDFV